VYVHTELQHRSVAAVCGHILFYYLCRGTPARGCVGVGGGGGDDESHPGGEVTFSVFFFFVFSSTPLSKHDVSGPPLFARTAVTFVTSTRQQ